MFLELCETYRHTAGHSQKILVILFSQTAGYLVNVIRVVEIIFQFAFVVEQMAKGSSEGSATDVCNCLRMIRCCSNDAYFHTDQFNGNVVLYSLFFEFTIYKKYSTQR